MLFIVIIYSWVCLVISSVSGTVWGVERCKNSSIIKKWSFLNIEMLFIVIIYSRVCLVISSVSGMVRRVEKCQNFSTRWYNIDSFLHTTFKNSVPVISSHDSSRNPTNERTDVDSQDPVLRLVLNVTRQLRHVRPRETLWPGGGLVFRQRVYQIVQTV